MTSSCIWLVKLIKRIKTSPTSFKIRKSTLYCSLIRREVHSISGRKNKKKSVVHLTNRFHVAVPLFSNRSQMTSKCRKNKEVAHKPQASVSLLFLPHFNVLCDLLLNRPTATWNLFVLYNDQKRKRPIHIPASNRLTF